VLTRSARCGAQDAALAIPFVALDAIKRDVREEDELLRQSGRDLLAGVADLRTQGHTRDFEPERCGGCLACVRTVRGKA
jgi:hypothetical protein